MLELSLQRHGDTLEVTLSDVHAALPFAAVALNATTWERIFADAVTYGRALYDAVFPTDELRQRLSALPAQERLLLVADDPPVAAIPWEYLRDPAGKLLAGRLPLLRGIPPAQRRAAPSLPPSVEIIAVPSLPVDEPHQLAVEREWTNLVQAVTTMRAPRQLVVTRVRPPTRTTLAESVSDEMASIVHFMGHGAVVKQNAFLVFEDARARRHLVDAADFKETLPENVLLVVMTSCLSAVVASTPFGNLAQALVQRGIPYALGCSSSCRMLPPWW